MTYEISALIFSLLTGYVSAKYEGKIISRVSVFMLLTAAGGFLASTIWEEENLLGSLFALVLGHIITDYCCTNYVFTSPKAKPSTDPVKSPEIRSTNDLLQHLANNEELELDTEISITVR